MLGKLGKEVCVGAEVDVDVKVDVVDLVCGKFHYDCMITKAGFSFPRALETKAAVQPKSSPRRPHREPCPAP